MFYEVTYHQCGIEWFGYDMFCQMNLITILVYLEQSGYKGDVLSCMVLEKIDDIILPDAFK
ncbi:hypothetical protein [Pelosinus fermentans]|uniref:Uncharacterized protein n=1 Tax=Pelosinus fermentans JBW45 TaxID=1192197 RepID=I8TRV3_9FIRM|nr:hypothetical protein [Pelosinus fermentans]AJQ25658.1 hypothetical protein JBW_00306 [Pelosinus fermentans JBW45]